MLAKSFRIYMSTIIFVMTFIVYSSNGFGYFASWDTAPNSLLVFNLLENHRLDFDNFKGTFPKEAAYMFTTNVDGHLQSVFPIGSAVLSAPIYVGIDLAVHAKHGSLPLASPAFEHERRIFEKVAATVIASLASVIFFLCVIELSTGIVAIILTLTFAFATSMWAIGAQAMWQHGSVNLMFLTMTLLLLQQQRYQGKRRVAVIALAGLAAGMLISIRPTASVFSFAALAWVFYTDKRNIVFFVLAAIAGIMPAAIWNIVNFHNLVGWYSSIAGRYHTSFFDALEAGAGLAISPSKGLLIYLPLTIFSLVGAIITVRSQRASERLLSFYCVAGLAVYCSYSLFQGWWGGYCFGPRYLTDLDALIVLLLVPFVHQMQLLYSQRHRKLEVTIVVAVASLFMIYSVGVQAVGAYGEPQGEWSSIPMSVDTHPDRVWDASDSQILRDAHCSLSSRGRKSDDESGVPGNVPSRCRRAAVLLHQAQLRSNSNACRRRM